MANTIRHFMNGKGLKGRYGVQNPDQSSHHVVFFDSEEARRASVQHFYVEDRKESYLLGTETHIFEHVDVAPPVVTEYSHGIQPVQHYGSLVKDRKRASPPKNYVPTKLDYNRFASPKEDELYKNNGGVQHMPPPPPPPQVTDHRRFTYPKNKIMLNNNEDGVDDELYYKPPLIDRDTQYDDARPPNSRMNYPRIYDNHHPEKKPREFSPNFQTRPTVAPPPPPYYPTSNYGKPKYSFDDHEDISNSSDDNPVFNMLRGLYLEKREGTNNQKMIKNNTKDDYDYKRSNHPLGKPSENNIGVAINIPTQAANKQTQFPGPGMEGAKQQGKYLPLQPNPGDDNYKRSNHPLSKPTDNKFPNVPSGATNQAKSPGPGKFPEPGMDKYSHPPNSGEKLSNVPAGVTNQAKFPGSGKFPGPGMDKYSHPPNSREKFLNVPAGVTNQAKFPGPGKFPDPGMDKYSHPSNSGEKFSTTFDSKEVVKENHNDFVENNKIKYDNEISGRPLTKPTDDTGTAMNMRTEGNNIANVPATGKKQQFTIKGLGVEGGKYSPPVPNSREKFSRTFDNKEAVKENHNGFVEQNRGEYDNKISGRPLTKPTADIGTATNYMLTEGNNFSNVPGPAATKKQQFTGLGIEGGKYSPPIPNSGERDSEIIGSKEAVERYKGAFVPR